jgi:predicted transposase/invertase (TIGR01784 family)
MSISHNPHDKYFKEVFSNKPEAVAFLKGSLPDKLVKNIDFRTLKPLKDSYVDEELQESFSDLVYTAVYKGKTDILITLLFEHKSRPERYPHLQLLKYMLKIWDANIRQKKRLVPVIPLVFYHGKAKWKQRDFASYFEEVDDNISPYIPAFDYVLNDLSKYSDEEIARKYNEIKTRTALLLMKNIFDEARLKQKIPFIFYRIREIENSETGERFFVAAINYLFNFVEEIDVDEVAETIKTITPKGGDIAMTIAAKLERKGRQKGLQEGLQKGLQKGRQEGRQEGLYKARKEAVINLFKKTGFESNIIADYLGLDKKFVEKVLKEAGLV